MGLYDDRLADLSEAPRLGRRVARRGPPSISPRLGVERPYPRPALGRPAPDRSGPRPAPGRSGPRPVLGRAASEGARKRSPMETQSLLFSRNAGWSPSKAKAWAKSHGYKHGKVDVTDQYVRIRQSDPQGSNIKRTVPFGRGIRAVVAREGVNSMATTQEARRRRSRTSGAPKRRRTTREASVVSAARVGEAKRRRRPKKARAAQAAQAAEAKRRRRPKKARAAQAAEAKRRRRPRRKASEAKRRSSLVMEARRPRRRRARASEAWKGDKAGHRKAALKGIRRKKRKSSRRVRSSVMEASRRRRSSSSPRRRSSRRMFEARSRSGGAGAKVGQFALAVASAGLGYVIADGLDRFLATYDPTATEKPKDKFTSDGAGTLANTLNVASSPGLVRIGAGIAATAVPAVAAMYVQQPFVRAGLEGAAIGAGVALFKTLWNNFLMPMLVGKDVTTAALQRSYIARLYPAEVAAHINLRTTDSAGAKLTPQMAVSSAGSGALSDPPQPGRLGAAPADVGPFALAASAGGDRFPTLANVWGTGGSQELPTASEALALGDEDFAVSGMFDQIQAAVKQAMPQASTAERAAESAKRLHKEMSLRCRVIPGSVNGAPAAGVAEVAAGVAEATAGVAQPPWQPNPNTIVGPGPQVRTSVGPQPPDTACGCIGESNPFLGFVGDEPAEPASVSLMT